MEQRRNFSSKLRQEREGAKNKLHTDGAKAENAISGKAAGQKASQALDAVYGEDAGASSANTDNNAGTSAAEFAGQKAEDALGTAKNLYDGHNRRQLKKAVKATEFAEKAEAAADLTDKSVKRVADGRSDTAKRITDGKTSGKSGNTVRTGRNSGKKLKKAGSIAGETLSDGLHGAVGASNEDDNVGVKAADTAVSKAEGTLRTVSNVRYSAKLRSRKQAAVSAVKQSAAASGYYSSNPYSRWRQRQELKKLYAARRTGTSGVSSAVGTAAEKAAEAARKISGFVQRHSNIIVPMIALALVLAVLVSSISSCSAMSVGSINAVLGTSYTAEDEDILSVEADYCQLEAELREDIENIESDYPGYDEYNYDIAEIGHDPYQLAALLTVLLEDYTEAEALTILDEIFALQYELELEEVVEIRTRTETRAGYRTVTDPDTGKTYLEAYEYEVEVEYEYYILNVTLTNIGITAAAYAYGLTEDQLERYEVLLETLGNKEYLFSDVTYATSSGSSSSGSYLDYDIPAEALTDTEFANMIAEAEKYLGMAYVWGGSSPSTGFDCSGFVCWVINNCGNGWNVGRTTANGLLSYCTVVSADEAQPGDLIFFQGTYDTTGASHVGIYVGNGMMLDCGNPVSYASIETSYWQSHLLCYGRLNQYAYAAPRNHLNRQN